VQQLTRVAADIVGDHDLPVVPADDTLALRQLDQDGRHHHILRDRPQLVDEQSEWFVEAVAPSDAAGRTKAIAPRGEHWTLLIGDNHTGVRPTHLPF
jgi:hypothetical protein